MTFFFCSILFRFPGGIFFFQPHILMFSCLHMFSRSIVSPFLGFFVRMFSSSLVPTRSLVLSSLHVLMFSCLHMFFLCSYCNHGVLLVIMTSLYNINESLNHGFLNCFSNLRIFFYYSNPPLVLKISKVLKPGFFTDFIFFFN